MAAEKGLNPNYNDNFKFFKQLDLYANVNLAFSVPSIKMRHQNVDIAIVKENTEGIISII
jgi:isocitrate/isopropylmalate dehydrogenase